MVRRQRAFNDQSTDSRLADGQGFGRLFERHLAPLGAFTVSIDGDVVILAQGCHARSRPRMSLSCRLPDPVESSRNTHVRHLPGHRPHQIDNIGVDTSAVLARAVLAHPQSGMILACPADDEIKAIVLHADDDLLDRHADDAFAGGDGRPFRMPGALDVGAEFQQRLPLILAYAAGRRGAERIELVLKPSLLLQALVPAPLELARDRPIVGIDGVISPSSVPSLETRLIERQLDLAALLDVLASTFLKSRQRRFDTERLNALDDLGGDRSVDAKTAEAKTTLSPMVDGSAAAMIARDIAPRSAVGDMQLATAMAAAEQAREQGLSAPYGAPAQKALAVGVVSDQALIPLEGVPANIPLMVVAHQNVSFRPFDR